MKEVKTKYIIVGQGLAGTCLSFQFTKRKIDHIVIDNNHEKCSSLVAAGLVNPVVFKRLTKSWQAELLMPYLVKFYTEVSEYLNEKIYEPRKLLRQLNSVEEVNIWMEKKGSVLSEYISETTSSDNENIPLKCKNELGVVRAGHLNTGKLIAFYANALQEKGQYVSQIIDYEKIRTSSDGVVIEFDNRIIKAEKLIFCEGAQAIKNPFFSNLNFKLCKGDVLTLSRDNYLSDSVFNNGKFYLPIDNEIKMGSTYVWDDLDYELKNSGRDELLKKHEETFINKARVVKHEVGIRPTVSDRRPILGKSKKTPNVFIFNGLGTKGAMIAPYYSGVMFDLITKEKELPQEVNIDRFL